MQPCTRKSDSSTERTITFISLFYCTVIVFYGVTVASSLPVVKDVKVQLGSNNSTNMLSFVFMSDIHLGPTVGKQKLQQAVDIVNSLNADLVAIIGDLTDGTVPQIKESAAPLKNIKATIGKYYVTGNHEYYTGDVDNLFKLLETEFNFHVLHNSHVQINAKGQSFCLAGTDDLAADSIHYTGHGMDLNKAVGSCGQKQPIILLAHQPKAAKLAADSDYNIKLVLSGHTHGGQMFPLTVFAYLFNPFFRGLYQYKNSLVYVSEGTVYFGMPIRVLSQCEISRILIS